MLEVLNRLRSDHKHQEISMQMFPGYAGRTDRGQGLNQQQLELFAVQGKWLFPLSLFAAE